MALRWPRVLSIVAVLFCAVDLSSPLPECIILDPLDRASFDVWTDCGDGKPTLTVKEYKSEVTYDPYDPEAKFVLTNTGSGDFCIQTGLVSSFSDNLASQIVYRVDQGKANLQLSLLDETDTPQMAYFLFGVGDWYILDEWLYSLEFYKIQITAEIPEGTTLMIENIFAVDLGTLQPECLLTDEEMSVPSSTQISETTEEGIESSTVVQITAENTELTPVPSTTEEIPYSPTTEDVTFTTPTESEISTTEDITFTTPTESEISTTKDVTSTTPTESEISTTLLISSSVDPSTSAEPLSSSDPTSFTDDSSSSVTWSTTPMGSTITDNPTPAPNIQTTTENVPDLPEPEETATESQEDLWMIIAIVFMSLFGITVLATGYFMVLPRYWAAAKNKSKMSSKSTNGATTAKSTPGVKAEPTNISKLPRLYIDRFRDQPIITAQHKTV